MKSSHAGCRVERPATSELGSGSGSGRRQARRRWSWRLEEARTTASPFECQSPRERTEFRRPIRIRPTDCGANAL